MPSVRAQAVVTTGEVTNAYLNILQRRYWPQLLMVGLLGGAAKAVEINRPALPLAC